MILPSFVTEISDVPAPTSTNAIFGAEETCAMLRIGRDEWMTVIEMQEYMRASRNKAYDLIWSGEIDSYRLGRKLLVSRASVDAYIESRSGRK